MPQRRIATVLMLDVVDSTHVAAQLGDARYRELSSRFNRIVRAELKRFGGKEEDNAGDGFFATFSQPDRAIGCASAIAEEVRTLGIEIRSGIHTGQTEDQAGKTHGIAVVIGARVMSLAGAGEILVTSTTKELVTGSGFDFEDFSAHELKGVPGTWQVFAVTTVDDRDRARPLSATEAAERREAIPRSGADRRPALRRVVAAGTALLVIAATIAVAATRGGPPPPPTDGPSAPASESIVRVDQAGTVQTEIPAPVPQRGNTRGTPSTPAHPMVVGPGGVWVLRSFRWLYHVDPRANEVRTVITLISGASFGINLAEGHDVIWVGYSGGLIEVNPATEEQRLVERVPPADAQFSSDVTVGGGFVWLGLTQGKLLRYDPSSGRGRWIELSGAIDAIAFGHGSVWTGDIVEGTVSRLDAGTLRPDDPIEAAGGLDRIVVGDSAVWVLSETLGTLTPIDPDTNTVGSGVRVGDAPTGLAAGAGAIWVGDEDGVIRRIDEDTRQVTEIPFGAEIRAIAFDEDTETLWIDVA